jgi:MFS transporter, DHA2 family, multidrug resistance protein
VALSLSAVLGVIYGLKHIAAHGVAWLPALIALAGVIIGFLFIRRQRRLAYPLLDLSLFRQASFAAAIAAYGLSCLAMFGIYIFIAQYLQLVLDLSSVRAGLAMLPWSLAFVVGSLLAPRMAQRWSRASILAWGLAISAMGFLLLVLLNEHDGVAILVVGTVIISLGMAPVFTIGNEMIITAAPPERAGAASAIAETSAEFSGALGIALFGSLGTAIYRYTLSSTMPDSVTPESANTALQTLGGAVAIAAANPGSVATALLESAHVAFVDALQFTAIVGALIVIGAALVSARMLRNLNPVREVP